MFRHVLFISLLFYGVLIIFFLQKTVVMAAGLNCANVLQI
jgi:hypothetical protein